MRTPSRLLAGVTAMALLVAACGDDDSTAASDNSTTTTTVAESTTTTTEAAASQLEITLTSDGIEVSQDSIPGGVVELTVTNETGASADANLSHVEGADHVDEFADAFFPVLQGGPFPDWVLNNAGVQLQSADQKTATSTVTLDPGDYVVWTSGDQEQGPSSKDAIHATGLTVTEAQGDAAFPDTVGTITAKDYEFSVDENGPGTYTFENKGPDQFHHAIIVDFGTNDAATVKKDFPDILTSDDNTPPPADLDASQINFNFAASGVFGPGSKGTFEVPFESGHTYAVVCFMSDRAGGPPHAMSHDMYKIISVA